jgi:hypothetical protein
MAYWVLVSVALARWIHSERHVYSSPPYVGYGLLIKSLEFCRIPQGTLRRYAQNISRDGSEFIAEILIGWAQIEQIEPFHLYTFM